MFALKFKDLELWIHKQIQNKPIFMLISIASYFKNRRNEDGPASIVQVD